MFKVKVEYPNTNDDTVIYVGTDDKKVAIETAKEVIKEERPGATIVEVKKVK
jgi:hypothetical protein